REFPRQALHAARLALEHPATGATLSFAAPLPADMEALIALLMEDAKQAGPVDAWPRG
ncbi:MAG: RNA pseudouridine synthase, partial [Gammaproteobacteria bacterium]